MSALEKQAKLWFITGATGFIGMEILRRILNDSTDRVVLLIRESKGKSVIQRGDELVAGLVLPSQYQTMRARVRLLHGDIAEPYFGLNELIWRGLSSVSHILHVAASTQFDAPLDTQRRTNAGGVATIIELARLAKEAGSLSRLGHVSTAFVAGGRVDKVSADDFYVHGPFRNTYEQSKWEGEALVRNCANELPVQILRPSIVIGDSRTGAVVSCKTIYWGIKNYMRGFGFVFARKNAPLDLVPVDYVADATLHIMQQPLSEQRCYLLAGGDRTTVALGAFAEKLCSSLGTSLPAILPPSLFKLIKLMSKHSLLPKKYDRMLGPAESYLPYFSANPTFDASATEKALAGSGIRVPLLDEYISQILDFCLAQGWANGPKSPLVAKSRGLSTWLRPGRSVDQANS